MRRAPATSDNDDLMVVCYTVTYITVILEADVGDGMSHCTQHLPEPNKGTILVWVGGSS
jgi:hypothetical protein